MTTVHDVAAYILAKKGQMTAMKLQKLVYYSQAWSLVWDEKPVFAEPIEAWANGPVAPALYAKHRGHFEVGALAGGSKDALSAAERETVDTVLKTYGDFTAAQLSELTHSEAPWRDAREGLAPGERGSKEITHADMAEFYGALYEAKAES